MTDWPDGLVASTKAVGSAMVTASGRLEDHQHAAVEAKLGEVAVELSQSLGQRVRLVLTPHLTALWLPAAERDRATAPARYLAYTTDHTP